MNLFGILFSRVPKKELDKIDLNHESIHTVQFLELTLISLLLLIILILITNISWWWLLASISTFYILYIIDYVISKFYYNKQKDAYYNICFEKEAYNNEDNLQYIKYRKSFSF